MRLQSNFDFFYNFVDLLVFGQHSQSFGDTAYYYLAMILFLHIK